MKHEEAMDRCIVIRDTLMSGTDLSIVANISNIEWITMCAEAIEKQIPKKPIEIHEIRSMDNKGNVTCEAIYFRCPVCNKSVQINRGCSNNECRQAIDWGKD